MMSKTIHIYEISHFNAHSLSFSCRYKMGLGKNFQDSLVLGRRFTAQEALDAGWLQTITGDSLLLRQSAQEINRIHGKHGIPRESLFNMKTDVYEVALDAFDKEISNLSQASAKL